MEQLEEMYRSIRSNALNKYFTTFRKTPVGGRLVPNFSKITHRDYIGITKLKIKEQARKYQQQFEKLKSTRLKPNKKIDLIGHVGEYGHTDEKTQNFLSKLKVDRIELINKHFKKNKKIYGQAKLSYGYGQMDGFIRRLKDM